MLLAGVHIKLEEGSEITEQKNINSQEISKIFQMNN